MDLLRRLAVQAGDLTETEGARAVPRLVALPHHVHEDLRGAEHALDGGRGEPEGGIAIVAAEGLDLGFDHLADGGAVGLRHLRLRVGAKSETEQQAEKGKEAKRHERQSTPMPCDTRLRYPKIQCCAWLNCVGSPAGSEPSTTPRGIGADEGPRNMPGLPSRPP